MGTGTGGEANEDTQDRNEVGSGDGTETGTGLETRGRTQDRNGSGDGNESSSEDGNGDEDGNRDGNEDRIGDGEREAKKHNKPHKNCRHHVGNGGDLGGKREKRRQRKGWFSSSQPR